MDLPIAYRRFCALDFDQRALDHSNLMENRRRRFRDGPAGENFGPIFLIISEAELELS